MALIDNYLPFQTGKFGRVIGGFVARETAAFRKTSARLKTFRATIAQLEALSDRELRDIGIARCSIRSIALERARLGDAT